MTLMNLNERETKMFEAGRKEIISIIHRKITPKQLHDWYLEATKKLNPESYNPKAQIPYRKLSREQKFIDKFICDKIMETIKEK